jgi:hypothetical protein
MRRWSALAWLAGAALACSAAGTTPLCRWVDAQGRTQLSDVVPEAYREKATCIDSRQHELTPEQRREAELRAAAAKQKARQAAAAASGAAPASGASGALASSAPAPAKRPAQAITEDTDCATRWRLYDESVECFGPFRTTRGATKPEAFERCNVVASPEPRCGPRVR